ncbi:MAG: hypothetical protein FWG15_04010 [Propionibacteriaceae bacterium]|nr:hypothetical protein [Propionibacteriaceae bacterium]
MSRYQNAIQTPELAETYAPAINQFMINEGFTLVDYKSAQVWKKGVGLATAPQFLSIQYVGNTIYLDAFIRYPILPGVYVGEMGLTGFIGALPKGLLKNRVQAVEAYIFSLWQQPMNAAPQPQQPQG